MLLKQYVSILRKHIWIRFLQDNLTICYQHIIVNTVRKIKPNPSCNKSKKHDKQSISYASKPDNLCFFSFSKVVLKMA